MGTRFFNKTIKGGRLISSTLLITIDAEGINGEVVEQNQKCNRNASVWLGRCCLMDQMLQSP